MPHSHAILYWNNNKTRPSLVHSRETINTGPTIDIGAVTHVLTKNSVCLMHLIIALKMEEFKKNLKHYIQLKKITKINVQVV